MSITIEFVRRNYYMTAILGSFLQTLIKFIFFLVVAGGGILCGKKFRDYKDAKDAGHLTEETK